MRALSSLAGAEAAGLAKLPARLESRLFSRTSSLTAVRQAKRVRPEANAGELWASHGPRQRLSTCTHVVRWLVHSGRGLALLSDAGLGRASAAGRPSGARPRFIYRTHNG